MILQTQRLILRPWQESDAQNLYNYAKDPLIGPRAGWQPHKSVEESLEIIKNVLAKDETYAVCLKSDNKAIGSISLMVGADSNISLPCDEAEIGYWIGVPFWGMGLIPEACREIIRHAREDLKLKTLWCGYFDGNENSKRVQEKCGFVYDHSNYDIFWERLNTTLTEHVSKLIL